MTPEERTKERKFNLKTKELKELNNEIQNDSKNKFYVVRGPKWD